MNHPEGENPRSHWRTLRLKAETLSDHGPVCCIPKCVMPTRIIDLDLKHPHPASFEIDHITPLSRGGAPYDRANTRPSHRLCNQKRGNRTTARRTQSRAW